MARQKLGQHFLTSGNVLERIAQAACGPECELAVEIGPGRGALTGVLLERAARVVAIELDRDLAEALQKRAAADTRLEVVEGDALQVDWLQWGAGVLAGNLPYYVASAMISKYLRSPGLLRQAVFLIQKEVAERITATPGHREYGYFSVECQLLANAEYLFRVPPGAFRPPPKVESAVIQLTPSGRSAEPDLDRFLSFVSACFRQKRKTLRNNLGGHFGKEALSAVSGLERRAEQLSVAEFQGLYRDLVRSRQSASSVTPAAISSEAVRGSGSAEFAGFENE